MKKLISILGLAFLPFNSCAQEHPKIERGMEFNYGDFEKYFLRYEIPKELIPETINIFYDLNGNGKSDLIASYKIKGTKITKDSISYRSETKACEIFIDENEDGKTEKAFYDFDNNGTLEKTIEFDEDGKIKKLIPEENEKKKGHADYIDDRWA